MSSMSHYPIVAEGSLLVDIRALSGIIVDLPHGALQGMRTEQKGYEDVVTEILSNQRALGEETGVKQRDIDRLLELNRQIAQIDQYMPAVRKLYELMIESRANVDDERQRLVRAVAEMVEARAKGSRDPSLLAKFEKTRGYRSAAGIKAVKTRKKNAAAAEAQESLIADAVEKALASEKAGQTIKAEE